jgi:hypothetical protein
MLLNFKTQKWIMLLLFIAISITTIFYAKAHYTDVESYRILEHYDYSAGKLQAINRGLPFKLLFVDAGISPYTINIDLGKQPEKGRRSLWIYAGQADNHGQLTINYKGKTIGTINNQFMEKQSVPRMKLSNVGEIDINGGSVNIEIIGYNNKLSRHFAELALIVLAPTFSSVYVGAANTIV